MTMPLSDWRIRDIEPGSGSLPDLALGRGDGWIATSAPGDTYLALVAAGRLDHPFRGRSEAAAEWVRHREWWWHTHFTAEAASGDETIELVFDGLDTFADIYLDGAKIASSNNMFRTLRIDVTAAMSAGEHDLAICFHPTATMAGERELPDWNVVKGFNKARRSSMRKAQFGWGWDWGPDLPTVGIWKPVRIERRRGEIVTGLNFTTLSIADDSATVKVDVELTGTAPVEVKLVDPDGAVAASGLCAGSASLTFTIVRPRLWWTADLGAQPLYTLVARAEGGADESRRVGIRTIAIDESPDPDEPGTTFFRFVLNGVPIFAKGACWIPASSFVGAIQPETYRDLVKRALGANMNMIRVWGGGIYEDDAFYDACDAAGLLVWQDFMFACAPYPDDDTAFVANVRAEIAEQVRRLRTHPCLAVWCGNNENQVIQFFDNYLTGSANPLIGLSLFERHIPETLREFDPVTPYRPSSPWGGPTPNSMRGGDVHDWTVWHGSPPVIDADPAGPMTASPEGIAYTRYAEDMARFVSEFGIQGAPELATLKRWLAPEDLALGSRGFRDRIKDKGDKATAMTLPVTGKANSIAEYVDFTMLTQAEGLKFGIEHFRRRKPHCSGALIWQFNDCWPCVSWSLIDYDGVAKASYYATKRAFAPVLASFRWSEEDAVELWITNDTLLPIADCANIALLGLDGSEDWRIEVDYKISANESAMVWSGRAGSAIDRVLTVRAASGVFPTNRLLLAPIKDIALAPDAGLTWSVEESRLTVTAARYALLVRVLATDAATRFDDNYFDLAAGETRMIVANHPIDPSKISVSSWVDRKPAHGDSRDAAEGAKP